MEELALAPQTRGNDSCLTGTTKYALSGPSVKKIKTLNKARPNRRVFRGNGGDSIDVRRTAAHRKRAIFCLPVLPNDTLPPNFPPIARQRVTMG